MHLKGAFSTSHSKAFFTFFFFHNSSSFYYSNVFTSTIKISDRSLKLKKYFSIMIIDSSTASPTFPNGYVILSKENKTIKDHLHILSGRLKVIKIIE